MHNYLRAIGFSKYTTARSMRPVLNSILRDPEESIMLREDGISFGHMSQSYGEGFGLRLYVEYESGMPLREDHYFPYADSDVISSTNECTVEQRSDKNDYCGMCEESSLGISLIFHLSNGMEYARRRSEHRARIIGVALTGLCLDGKILLPLSKSVSQREYSAATVKRRTSLIEAAKDGDEAAMESLAMDDMNIMQQITERIPNEDVYSMVDTCFMPCGLESDKYTILGEILSVETVENTFTGEEICRMLLECNDIRFKVMINRRDLLGAPEPGRRFKGDIWLQGRALFEN